MPILESEKSKSWKHWLKSRDERSLQNGLSIDVELYWLEMTDNQICNQYLCYERGPLNDLLTNEPLIVIDEDINNMPKWLLMTFHKKKNCFENCCCTFYFVFVYWVVTFWIFETQTVIHTSILTYLLTMSFIYMQYFRRVKTLQNWHIKIEFNIQLTKGLIQFVNSA